MYMKCVLIIGGNCDIGRELTKYLLDKDISVVIGYHNDNNKYFNDVEYIKCDVTDSVSIDNIIRCTKEKYGNIDMMINLSGLCMDNSFLNKTKDEFMNELEVNLVGTFICNQIYSRYIDNGIIVNLSSTDGVDTYNEYNMGYAASKAGIISISKNIAGCTKNKILCLVPNWIDTSSTKMIDNNYLTMELKRIGQDRLIRIDEFIDAFDNIINSEFNSGSVFRIDIRDGKIWVEKI